MRAATAMTTGARDKVAGWRAARGQAAGQPAVRRALGRGGAITTAAVLLAACGGSGTTGSAPSSPPSSSPATVSATASASASASTGAGTAPGIAAVTAHGALVLLDPATGAISKTLVPAGVLGDEISVSPGGSTIYFSSYLGGCTDEVESIPVAGGSATEITKGSLPAISPDGTKLAAASEPAASTSCTPNEATITSQYKLIIRTLSSGAQKTLSMLPAGQSSGLPAPISHLSWSPANSEIAVSISSVEDNEGWNLNIVSATTASYYESGPGVLSVPIASGATASRGIYYREGVFLPSGQLFVSRACCAGVPVRNTSRLLWEVNTAGQRTHQVAIGYPNLVHDSLSVSPDGTWLLYLGGPDLYVSHNGNTPSKLTTGLIAAAWL